MKHHRQKKLSIKLRLLQESSVRERVHSDEIFSSVVRHTSIRVLLVLVARQDLELEKFHVKRVCLHGELEKEIYILSRMVAEFLKRKTMYVRFRNHFVDLSSLLGSGTRGWIAIWSVWATKRVLMTVVFT